MHMHTEYASITDELETVCGLLSPPRSPGLLSPPRPEQSPPSKFVCGAVMRLWLYYCMICCVTVVGSFRSLFVAQWLNYHVNIFKNP